jgi:SAM-dependent methyltransferase
MMPLMNRNSRQVVLLASAALLVVHVSYHGLLKRADATYGHKHPRGQEQVLTKAEKHYDCAYQEWQLSANKFGAKAKMHYFSPYMRKLKNSISCAEFGASSGHILSAMPCGTKVGIEVNACARAWGEEHLGLTYVSKTQLLPSNQIDFIYTTSVLEHVECPTCEVREIYRVLRVGGVFVAQVPGMAPGSMTFVPNGIDNELQMFGALELGNILISAGFRVDPTECSSDITQWPDDFESKFEELGEEKFIEASKKWGESHQRLVTTTCVGYK